MKRIQRFLDARRAAAARAWDLDDEIVLVSAGSLISQPGKADRVYPFIPHSDYFWLTDRVRPDSVLAFDPQEGWVDFVPPVSRDERVWEGGTETEGVDVAGLAAWLDGRSGRPLALLGAPYNGISADSALSERLAEALLHARRPKDELELERMRQAAQATAAGFAALPELLQPGTTERRVQIELEAAFFRAGAERTGYDTIVGSGPHAAVLHFPPGDRELRAGELVLVDAGAEVAGYTADVTRTYGVAGTMTPEQKDLYQVVLQTELNAIGKLVPGTEYRDVHLGAALDLARGLVDFGVLRGDPESLVENEAIALFFPHGIGHMVGLGVRDAGGYLSGRERSDRPVLRFLRVDLPLEVGYVLTIEPGLYFIPALLDDSENRTRYRQEVDWERVDRMKDFGGIRIEDNLLVTDEGPENLTSQIEK